MTLVWLVRHGESEANAGLPTGDTRHARLTELGRTQASDLRGLTSGLFPTLVITSPYLRAQETAELALGPSAAGLRREVWPVEEFTYLDGVKCRGTTHDQRRPMADAYWDRCDPERVEGEGAESFADFRSRSAEFLRRLREERDGRILVFSHCEFIKSVLHLMLRGFVNSPDRDPRDGMVSYRHWALGFRRELHSIRLHPDQLSLHFVSSSSHLWMVIQQAGLTFRPFAWTYSQSFLQLRGSLGSLPVASSHPSTLR
jgi:broad specificity phosphatase PhoE